MNTSRVNKPDAETTARKLNFRCGQPRDAVSRKGTLGGAIGTCVLITALSVPMLERNAKAEEGQPESAAPTCPAEAPLAPLQCPQSADFVVEPTCEISACTGSEARLHLGTEWISALVVNEHFPLPEMTIGGPATVTFRFYPALLLESYGESGETVSPVDIRVSVRRNGDASESHSFGGASRRTDGEAFDSDGIGILPLDDNSDPLMAIGTEVIWTTDVGEGMHRIAIQMPPGNPINGFLQVEISPAPEPEPVPEAQEVPEPAVVEPLPIPVESPRPEPERVPPRRAVLTGERLQLNRLGGNSPSPDIYSVDLVASAWRPHPNVDLLAAAFFSSVGLPIESGSIQSSLRSLSAGAGAGVGLGIGDHRLQAIMLAGWRGNRSDVFIVSDESASSAMRNTYEIGGIIQYAYGPYLAVTVLGSNNPLNPVSASLAATAPIRRASLSLDADFRWMQGLSTAALEDTRNLDIGQDYYYLRILLSGGYSFGSAEAAEPGARLWSLTPRILLGTDMAVASLPHDMDLEWADFLVGLSLEADVRGFGLEARGLVSALTGRPASVLLSLNYGW